MIQMILALFHGKKVEARISRDRLARALMTPEERKLADEWMGQGRPIKYPKR